MSQNKSTEAATSLVKLHSKDHEEILNVIDQLRSEGISRFLNLPQLIVCGDQSSGKSSVLEAISGLDFPRKDNLCTRFATELILRRAPQDAIKVSIHPDNDRSEAEQEKIRCFKPSTLALKQFASIVRGAGDFLGIGQGGRIFSKDILRVELQGPSQPHLTLVDLPGLYHAPDKSQDEEGVEFVESLISSYMQNSRSVILAVISAKNDIALQKVTSFTRKVDPQGLRTIGIITKPDTLSRGSNMEQAFYQLALNKRVVFSLGWHVLKNRNFKKRNKSLDERCVSEITFLSDGIWATLPRRHVGIDALRPRLSSVLRDHILSELPSLIEETRITLKESQGSLHRMGLARQTLSDQRRYLFQTSERFNHLMNGAVNGNYNDPYFGDAMTDHGYEKRLRAVVQNHLTDFSDAMRTRGQSRKIRDDDEKDDNAENQISRSALVDEVRQRIRRSRGRELPGTFNPLIISELFYLHSKPWNHITGSYIETLLSDLQKAILPILSEIVDDKSAEGLLRRVINPKFDELEAFLRSKSAELLGPQRRGHPITYNHYFIDCVQKAREQHRQKHLRQKLKKFFPRRSLNPAGQENHTFNLEELINSLAVETETDMEKFACSEAIDCMLAYYKVARKKFVDDFSNLAVEKCFLDPLSTMFTSRTVNMLEDDVIEDIAAEDESSRQERQRLGQKINILEQSLQRLHSLDRYYLALMIKASDVPKVGRSISDADSELSDFDAAERDEASTEKVEQDHTENTERALFSTDDAPAYSDDQQNTTLVDPSDDWANFKSKKKRHPSANFFEKST
ncbi:hypothetical protein MMC13_003412 [Lambiella insularis]|nr:hypothetical protein [Lambiella insularis]